MNAIAFRNIAMDVLKRSAVKHPETAIVHAIDGNVCDIRIRKSGGIIREVPIVGDPSSINVGEAVTLVWSSEPGCSGPRPSVLKGTAIIMISQE